MQCLIASPKFSEYFRQGLHSKEINKGGQAKGKAANLFADLVKKANSGKPEEESPQELKDLMGTGPASLLPVLAKIYPEFDGYEEQDAHEFLTVFLDALSADLNRVKKKPPFSELKANSRDPAEDQVSSDVCQKSLTFFSSTGITLRKRKIRSWSTRSRGSWSTSSRAAAARSPRTLSRTPLP